MRGRLHLIGSSVVLLVALLLVVAVVVWWYFFGYSYVILPPAGSSLEKVESLNISGVFASVSSLP